MPRIDGWEVLQALQLDPHTKNIPIIVCSAWVNQSWPAHWAQWNPEKAHYPEGSPRGPEPPGHYPGLNMRWLQNLTKKDTELQILCVSTARNLILLLRVCIYLACDRHTGYPQIFSPSLWIVSLYMLGLVLITLRLIEPRYIFPRLSGW